MISNEDLSELRKRQIYLLDEFKKICDKHNLIYWIDFGGLLGAVRYKGFIPWDDDIDISMPMADYKKFLKIAQKELPENIFLQTPKTDKSYRQCFTKLCDRRSTYLHPEETGDEIGHQGIYMDIFPSFNYPIMPKFIKKGLLYLTGRSRVNAVINKKNIILNYTIYLLCKLIWLLLSPFKSNMLGQTVEDNWYYYAIPKAYIFPLKNIEFENKFYPAPNNTHEYLSMMYGENYIIPPPIEKRIFRCKKLLLNTPCKFEKELNKLNGDKKR